MKIDKVTASWVFLLVAGACAYNGLVALAFHKPYEAAGQFVTGLAFLGVWIWTRRKFLLEEEQRRRNAKGS
jgi:hypothetical protein